MADAPGILFGFLLVSSYALPRISKGNLQEFMGTGTNELAIAVLQGYVEKDSNLAFSPLGYSTLLAVLAEGARGDTKKQLVSALHLPDNEQLARESYRSVLEGLRPSDQADSLQTSLDQAGHSNKDGKDVPEFRNWFYIYKNFSVDSDYKDVLLKNYLTEIRNVERVVDDELPDMTDPKDSNKEVLMEDESKESGDKETVKDSMQSEQSTQNNVSMPKEKDTPTMNKDESVTLDKESEIKTDNKEEVTKDFPVVKPGQNLNDENKDSSQSVLSNDSVNKDAQGEENRKEGLNNMKDQTSTKNENESESSNINQLDEMKKKEKDEEAMMIAASLMEEALQNHAIEEGALIEKALQEQNDPVKADEGEMEATTESVNVPTTNTNIKSETNDAIVGDDKKPSIDKNELKKQNSDKSTNEMSMEKVEKEKGEIKIENNNMKLEEAQLEEKNKIPQVEAAETEKESKPSEMCEKDAVQKEKEEMMTAMESGRKMIESTLKQPREVTTGLSGNRIVQKSSQKPDSVMIIFNALYYKGSWKTPFTKQPAEFPDVFYKSDTEKINTPFLHSVGTYNVGAVPELDSTAIEIPYKGGRYSLLILLPNQRTGVRSLVGDKLTSQCLKNIGKYLSPKDVQVCVPRFQVETVSKPIESLKKFGITDIFDQEKADLSGLSKEPGLYVDDVAQFVTINVDRDGSAANYLTSSSILPASTRSGEYDKFVADHPFLFFVRDNGENVIVVAGKLADPSKKTL